MTIERSEVAAEFAAAQAMPTGEPDRGAGPEDDYNDEGYDETQRAEILEVESTGPTDGAIQTDLRADMGGGDADDDEIEDDEDRLDAVVDTDEAFTGGTSVLGEDEGEPGERDDSDALIPADGSTLAEEDEDDFDVDDESDGTAGPIGA